MNLLTKVAVIVGITAEISAQWGELVSRVRTGDEGSLEELYKAVAKSARGTLFRSVDPQSVEDHVHEIMVIVLEAIRAGEIRDPSCLMSFVRTVTHRRVSLHIRGAMLRRKRLVSIDSAPEPSAPFNQSPEARAALREKVDGVWQVIASLPARDQEILIRFYHRDQDAEQICREMSLTATQFRLGKSRAIAKCGSLTHPRSRRVRSKSNTGNREYAGNLGKIVDDLEIAPAVVEHQANGVERVVPEFKDQAAARFQ
jgi:RNA polymerase sigma factor (sigma-70 family)